MKIDKVFNAEDFCIFVDRYCHKAGHRPILVDRYCEGMTYEKLAEKYNYPERYIKYIVYKYNNIILKFYESLK